MNESIHKYAKIGIIHFMAYPETQVDLCQIEETVGKIAEDDYFDAIEITWIKDKHIRQKVKKIIDTSHLTTAYSGGPRLMSQKLNINDIDESNRLKAVETLKEGIDEAYEMGCVGFGFLSGQYPQDEEGKEEAYRVLVESTKELCDYAQSKGDMKIILEVFDYDMDKKSLIGPVSLAKRFAEEITEEHKNFGLMVDLSHIPLLRETVEESILPIKDYILHAHMGNCVLKNPDFPGYGDLHPRFGFPNGENDVNELVEFLRVLKLIGFLSVSNRPILSFEVKPFGDENPNVVIANSKRVLNNAWALL